MLDRPSANSATHSSQIFIRIHPCSNNSKTRLEAFVYALTWNGLGLDFLRDSTKPFGWFSDSFTQVAKWKRKRLLPSPKTLLMKPTPFFRHFAICEYAKQAHISGYSHQNTFWGACASKMPICSVHTFLKVTAEIKNSYVNLKISEFNCCFPVFFQPRFHAALFKYITISTKGGFVVIKLTLYSKKQEKTKLINKRSTFTPKH